MFLGKQMKFTIVATVDDKCRKFSNACVYIYIQAHNQ
jgi:hypothetical protein